MGAMPVEPGPVIAAISVTPTLRERIAVMRCLAAGGVPGGWAEESTCTPGHYRRWVAATWDG
jgi:hypothetical protein